MNRQSTALLTRRVLDRILDRILAVFLLLAACGAYGQAALAQVADRIAPSLDANTRVALEHSLHPLAQPRYDVGRANGSTKLTGMLMVFEPSASQEVALKALLVAQQNPASPEYHQWLTPAGFGAQYGMSAEDIATTEAWLEQQGFQVLSVANARNAIRFSGTAAQVEAAFHTEMHNYTINGVTHLANSTALTLPAGLAGVVAGIRNIAQFHPRPFHVRRSIANATGASALKPNYTDSSGFSYLAPSDITTIYDIKALYNAGFTGTNQSIAIMGQTAIATSDLDNFRISAGLPTKEPTQILVPNSGSSVINPDPQSDDEFESDIDLEWSSAIAQNATIDFVYTGSDYENYDVIDSLQYAVDNNVAPILSLSYGECETQASSGPLTIEPILMAANAQGQTVIASSGDSGATGCDTGLDSTGTVAEAATQGLSVNYPASSAYVTGMGGTEFNTGTTSYFSGTNDQYGGSAISYIPEAGWNETSINESGAEPGGFDSSGGGASVLFGKPSWQSLSIAGMPNDNARDVPDISLEAANDEYGYLLCNAGSCLPAGAIGNVGTPSFANADANNSIAGGTSFDAPIFAGILALISEESGSVAFGNINPALYSIYTTSSPAFHDITTGNNQQPCSPGSTDCPTGVTDIGYSAGLGYDQVTGLGTIDAYNLASVFPASKTITSGSLTATTTTLQISSQTPLVGTALTFTAGVTASAGTTVPSGGTVQFAVNTVNQGSPVSLSSAGTASFSYTPTAAGNDTVTATYSGTSTFASSSSTLAFTVSPLSTGQFTLAATNVTVASGASGTSTLTITPSGAYNGTVTLSYDTPSTFVGCLGASESAVAVTGTAPVSVAISVYTSESACQSTAVHRLMKRAQVASTHTGETGNPLEREKYPIAAAALLASFMLIGSRRRRWPLVVIFMLASLGTVCGLSGCGSSSNNLTSSSVGNVPAGTYIITLIGQDSSNAQITATTTFTATVQ